MITVSDLLELLQGLPTDALVAIAFEDDELRFLDSVEDDTDDDGCPLVVLWPEEPNVQPSDATEH
jgi:hypothetical protein